MNKSEESRFLLVLLLCSVFFASSLFKINALTACRPSQIQALEQFKNEFDSQGCNSSDYFNGVQCDNTTGEVTKLQLPGGCLTGTLKPNSSLFRFHQLRYLNLSHNNFTSSSLPSQFSNLNRLELLSLSSIGFIGQVPSSIRNLSLLSYLDLSQNKLTGNFFPFVLNLSKLYTLDLSNNQFSGIIPSSLFTMPSLLHLDLAENHFTGLIEIPNFSSPSQLESLYLGYNQFEEQQILKPISKFTNLKFLTLPFLNISYPIDLRLLSSLKSLNTLDLSGNTLLKASMSSDSDIPLSLKFLDLSGCYISEFPSFLKTLQNLQFLDISSNIIEGKVPEWLWSLPHLNVVNLVSKSVRLVWAWCVVRFSNRSGYCYIQA